MLWFRRREISKLDFIIGGVQKAGTTALHYYLKKHSNVTMPFNRKEQHFFDNEDNFRNDTVDYSELHAAFTPKRKSLAAGECTPIYIYWRPAMQRIQEYNPQIKMIFLLRNPVQRAFSQWNMQRQRGADPLDFREAVAAEPGRIAAAAPLQLRKFSYVDRGRYAEQIERARSLFPEAQLLFLKYEEFRNEQQRVFDRICQFLTVPQRKLRRTLEAHHIPYHRKLEAEDKACMLEVLRGDIARVETLLGWDCSDWLS